MLGESTSHQLDMAVCYVDLNLFRPQRLKHDSLNNVENNLIIQAQRVTGKAILNAQNCSAMGLIPLDGKAHSRPLAFGLQKATET